MLTAQSTQLLWDCSIFLHLCLQFVHYGKVITVKNTFDIPKTACRITHSRMYQNKSNKGTGIQQFHLNQGCATSNHFGRYLNSQDKSQVIKIKVDLLLYRSQKHTNFLKPDLPFPKNVKRKNAGSIHTISNGSLLRERYPSSIL